MKRSEERKKGGEKQKQEALESCATTDARASEGARALLRVQVIFFCCPPNE